MAELSAWTMFIRAIGSPLAGGGRGRRRVARLALRLAQRAQLALLRLEVGRHLLEDVLEHRQRIERWSAGEGSVALGLLPGRADVSIELLLEPCVPLLGPLAERDEALLEARDRISERPRAPFLLGTVARRIVAGRVRAGPVGHELDERRAAALAGALRGPLGHRIHGEKIVAVDADTGDAITRPALCEGLMLAAGETLEGGDGPLIVYQVENHRRLVHGRER